MRQRQEKLGRERVRAFLESRGYHLQLECWRAKGPDGRLIYGLGEVDLFFVHPSKNHGLLVEVKARHELSGPPLITEMQLRRLRRSRGFLQRRFPQQDILLVLVGVKVPEGTLEFLWNP